MFKDDCNGCNLSQGKISPRLGGTIVELNGGWTLNHNSAGNAFLGWMILQPKCHRMELNELTAEEAQALGANIKNVDEALCAYWTEKFPNDPIERVYIVYFFESAFSKSPETWHLHIHLIPRTRKLGRSKPAEVAAWNIWHLVDEHWFPADYRLKDWWGQEEYPEKAEALMKYLKARLDIRKEDK